ncbi:putative N-acetyltransferase YafP [Salmonella enterica subsp. enterica serovar Choleraesuis]|nr:putative N-acetyltransferase YafP [Salmonella enterica subsp. enterica serovar Choleraesuis]
MNLNISVMYEHESDALAELMIESIKTLAAQDYTPAQVEAWARLDMAAWPGRLHRQQVWVARDGDRPVGFISLAPGGYIDLLFVAPDWALRGVASRLLETLEQAAGAEQLPRLKTEASLTARAFFERHGFLIEERQRVEVRGESFINFLMEKSLAA